MKKINRHAFATSQFALSTLLVCFGSCQSSDKFNVYHKYALSGAVQNMTPLEFATSFNGGISAIYSCTNTIFPMSNPVMVTLTPSIPNIFLYDGGNRTFEAGGTFHSSIGFRGVSSCLLSLWLPMNIYLIAFSFVCHSV